MQTAIGSPDRPGPALDRSSVRGWLVQAVDIRNGLFPVGFREFRFGQCRIAAEPSLYPAQYFLVVIHLKGDAQAAQMRRQGLRRLAITLRVLRQ